MNEYIKVPRQWLEGLLKHVEEADEEVEKLEFSLPLQTIKLLGYASSAKTILKFNQIEK